MKQFKYEVNFHGFDNPFNDKKSGFKLLFFMESSKIIFNRNFSFKYYESYFIKILTTATHDQTQLSKL